MRIGLIHDAIALLDKVLEMNLDVIEQAKVCDPMGKKLISRFMSGKIGDKEYESTRAVVETYIELTKGTFSQVPRTKQRVRQQALRTRELYNIYLRRRKVTISDEKKLREYLQSFYDASESESYISLLYSDRPIKPSEVQVIKELLEISEHDK